MTAMSSEREKCARRQPSNGINRRKALEAAFAGFALAIPTTASAAATPGDVRLAELVQAYRAQFGVMEQASALADQASLAAYRDYPDPPECIRCYECIDPEPRKPLRGSDGKMRVMKLDTCKADIEFDVLFDCGLNVQAAEAYTLQERRAAKRAWKGECARVRKLYRVKELEAASAAETCKLNDLEAEIAETKPDTFIVVAAKLDLWLFILGWSQSPRFLELSPEMRLGYVAACDAVKLCHSASADQRQERV